MAYTYSTAALVAAHEAFRDLLDAETAAANLTIHAADDTLLGTMALDDPCGSVDPSTGQLTFSVAADEDAAPNGGAASYGRFNDGAGVEHLHLDCQAGSTTVAGALVLRTLTVVEGSPIELVSATIG